MTTYSSKSNAARAFRTQCPAKSGMTTSQLVEAGYIDEDTPGGDWVVNLPDDCAAEDEFEAGVAEELANRQRIEAEKEAARIAEEERIEREHPMARPDEPAPAPLVLSNVSMDKTGNDGKCPHCGASTRGGSNVTEFSELSPGSQRDTDQQYTCNSCAGEWGPKVDKPKTARAKSGSSNGLKIEKDRESRNGVTRPSVGGKCRGIWDALDDLGLDVTAKTARDTLMPKGFDRTTIMVQFYKWRKFNGIEGRQA